MHDCTLKGHVMVDDDVLRECLVCGDILQINDKVSLHVTRTAVAREFGEGHDPSGIVQPDRPW